MIHPLTNGTMKKNFRSMANGLQSKLGIQKVYCLKMYLNGVRLRNGMIQGHVMQESAYYIFKNKKKKVYIRIV